MSLSVSVTRDPETEMVVLDMRAGGERDVFEFDTKGWRKFLAILRGADVER